MKLSILYRGPLSSCNYGCDYCPFAKTKNTRDELADDARKLEKFTSWIAEHPEHSFGILFTPWGEGLIREYYQKALVKLSHFPNVHKVAIQTNLSCSTRWMEEANKNTIAFWTTYHPTQVSRKSFVKKCKEMDTLGIRYSVGVVGFKESFDEISKLRVELSPEVYVWINAYKRESNYYTEQDIMALKQIDRLFDYNTKYYSSEGKSCRSGHRAFSVDGEGNMHRCHFISTAIGNIYQPDFEKNLYPRLCSNKTCGCHIGYVHMDDLKLDNVFGDGLLERIPVVISDNLN